MISPISRITTVQPNSELYQSKVSKNQHAAGPFIDETNGIRILQKATTTTELGTPLGASQSQLLDQINQSAFLQLLNNLESSAPRFGRFTNIFDPNVSPNYFTGQLAVDMFTLFNAYNNGYFNVASPEKAEIGGDILHETGYFEKYIQDYKDPFVKSLAYKIIGNESNPDLIVDKIHQYLIGDANLQNGVNGYDYIADANNPLHIGLSEYWNTARNFLEGPGGDCEDFAIAAMNLLLAASEKPGLQGKLNPNNFRIYAVLANDGATISEEGVVSNERLGGHAFLAYKRTDGTWVQVDGTYLPSLDSVKDRKPLTEEPNYYKALYYFDKFGAVFERGNINLLENSDFPYAKHKQLVATAYLAAQQAITHSDGFIGRNIALAV